MKKRIIFIIIIEIYLMSTFLLYLFGPIKYEKNNLLKLVIFIMLFQIALFMGFWVAEKFIKKNNEKKVEFNIKKINLFISIINCISIFFSIMVLVRYTNSFNPFKILSTIFTSIFDAKAAYYINMNLNVSELIGGRIITTLSTFFSPIYYLAIPLGIYFFKKINIPNKILVVLSIVCEILSFIIKGTNFGIFRVAIIIITMVVLKILNSNKLKKINTKKIITCLLMFLIIIISVVCYFMYSTTSRMGGKDNLPETISGALIEKDNLILRFLPSDLKFGMVMVISYISQGYQGMSLAFNYDFTSTFGAGSGRFLTENIEEILNINIYERTYQYKMKEFWHPTINWHTAYTWFANDISFYGVIILMFIIGFIFNIILNDACEGDLVAISLIPLYIILFIFLSANNVIFSMPSTCMPFILLHLIWAYRKGIKYIKRRKEKYE